MWAGRQPARYLSTISLRPCSVVRALPWDTRTSEQVLGLRQATPHSEVLLRSSRHRCHQRPGRVQLDEIAPHAAALVHTRQNSAGAVIASLSIAAATHGKSQAETENLLVEAIQDRNLR